MKTLSKILAILSLPLILSACGGGGGGAGGAASYTVPSCTDSGTRDTEYLFMGSYGDGSNGLTRVCASAAYARDATGDGIKVAVLDTGITVNGSNAVFHTELDANVTSFTSGSDLIGTDNVPNDENGHGSHVAGIIAGENNGSGYHGVAYDATLYIYKVLNDSGSSVGNSVASGITKARGDGVDIMNLSLGDSGVIGTTCNTAAECETSLGSTLYTELEASGDAGKILVWAAGNAGKSSPSVMSGAAIYDDDFKETTVIVVASGTDGKIGTTSNGWSSGGSNKCGIAAEICITAPGTLLYSALLDSNSQATALTGTSMAAPMVSGGLALIKQEFSSLTNAQVVDRLFATATDTDEYSQGTIYGHGMMNLSAATAAVGSLQTIGGGNLLDDSNTSYYDLVDNNFTSSASFSNALINALAGQTMQVYDSFDRANFETNVSSFFTSGSYTSQNTVENHMARLQPKNKEKVKHKNLYGNFTMEVDGNYLQSSMFQSAGDFLALGYNQSTNSFENAVDPLSDFFNDSNFGNNYLVNPYFHTGSGQDYFMSFNSNSSFGMDTFTNANGNDLGLAFNLNPLSSTNSDTKNAGDLQIVLGTNYEQNKFLNSSSTGAFATGDMSNTNFTGVKYKKNLGDDFTFVGSGFAGYTHIDKASNSYIDKSTPLLTSTFTLGLAKSNFIKKDQRIGFFVNQPQRVEDGSLNLRVPTSSDRDRTVTYSNLNVDLEPDARQINYDIIFQKAVTETSNLSANLTHVQNGDHSNSSTNQNFISLFYKKTF
ncbi:S8 family peptidase [Candidatus Pelagibacter sp. Uisw_090]|uniref:S8 family peptidase n=1 Tax=Candidatus Pelagibacter sp. Uisw_090 TaxID=3230993 RepID=UPI0039EB6611